MLRGENIFPKNMISRGPVYIIYVKTDSTVKNREYAFSKTFESVFDEDTFFNSCLQGLLRRSYDSSRKIIWESNVHQIYYILSYKINTRLRELSPAVIGYTTVMI